MKKEQILFIILFLTIGASSCININHLSNSNIKHPLEDFNSILIIGETTVPNYSFIEGLSLAISKKFDEKGIENKHFTLLPNEVSLDNTVDNTVDNTDKKLKEIINNHPHDRILRLRKADGIEENTPGGPFIKRYPDYVFDTTLEMTIMETKENKVQYKSLINIDSWGGIRVELKGKSEKIAKKIVNQLEKDLKTK